MEAIKLLLSTRRNIITLLVIAVLGIGLLAGLWLVQRQTQLKSKAAASPGGEVKFRGPNVSGEGCTASTGDCTATDRNIQLEINNPFSQAVSAAPPIPTSAPTSAPTSSPPATTTTTYTIAEGYSDTQGKNNWHYYYKVGTNNPVQSTYGTALMQMQNWFGQPDDVYWHAGSNTWMAVDPNINTAGNNEIALIYWKAPGQGQAQVTVTEKRHQNEVEGAGNGFAFGIGHVSQVGQETNSLTADSIASTDLTRHTITGTYQMRGDDAIYYFKNSQGETRGDASEYTIEIKFTPSS